MLAQAVQGYHTASERGDAADQQEQLRRICAAMARLLDRRLQDHEGWSRWYWVASLLPSLGDLLAGRTGLIIQSLVGLALLVYSLRASASRQPSPVIARPSAGTYAALVMLGVSVTAMELPTSIPYFAAIALITEAGLSIREWAPLLGIYNVIFVVPPIALLAGHLVLQGRMAEPYAALRQRLESGARETMLWVAGLVGGGLLVTGVIELVARLR